MLSNASNELSRYFAAGSCDWTPVLASHMVHLVYMPFKSDAGISGLSAAILSADEIQRLDRFRAGIDKVHFSQRRAFRRYCGAKATGSEQPLARIDFSETDKGKPFIAGFPDISFGFSSCKNGFLGSWSTTGFVGVDIESETRQMDYAALAHQYFSTAEATVVGDMQGLKRTRAFYRFWTLKEAALKCIGEGLPLGLDVFEFELSPDLQITNAPAKHGGPNQFSASLIEEANNCAALVIRKPED